MNDSDTPTAQGAPQGDGWLMLITSVPAKPDYLRVKLRRRVQRLGAVGLKGAVYLLPEGPEAEESFQWLRREIVADGGEATICAARLLDGMTNADVTELFNADRAGEYGEFVLACRELESRWNRSTDAANQGALIAERGRLRKRLEEILGRDFFGAAEQEEAMQALEQLIVLDIPAGSGTGDRATEGYRGRTWATRAGVKVDRIASAWLIRRHIDRDARFEFVPAGAAASPDSVRFDMFDGEFTHQGNRCTFEVLLDHFGITDPAIQALGEMVHDIDLHDERFGRAETAGLAALIDGIVRRVGPDQMRVDEGARMLDAIVAGLARGSSTP